ncbi:hypothetical protein G6F42_021781 [Rhizopus arrhizus]|nr:hypothetical protein G6F42_021781 [Rhizopus arrhizus]
MQGKTNCRQASKRIRNLIRPDFIVQQQENISWGPPVVIGEIKVNTTVSIYIISLVSPGFYIMLEVCSFVIPRDLTQLRSFLAVAEDLLPIKKLYNDHCRKPDSGLSISNIRAGLLDAA